MLGGQKNPGERLSGFFNPRARSRYETESRERAMSLLKQVGIDRFAEDYAGILSGGQRKLLDLFAIKSHCARVRCDRTANEVKERGLSGAIRANDRRDAATFN